MFLGRSCVNSYLSIVINRTPSNDLCDKKKTPFEMWHRKPNLKYLKASN